MPLKAGDVVGAYELVRVLGGGGMGQVWLASEPRLRRKVALKFLPDDLIRDQDRVARFEVEARSASALNHPNVCHIYSVGESDSGSRFIAMELIEGETLRDRLQRERLSVRDALDIAIQIAAALVAAHAAGIVHRDLKPENVMLRGDGFVKVLDFGLAKLVHEDDAAAANTTASFVTRPGVVVGTFAYMSPEQARGQAVDARSDVWSLGVVLYEMVARRNPFAAPTSSDVLAAILDRELPPIVQFDPHAPRELQRILTKALRKDRTQRYQTVEDFLLDLQVLRDELRTPGSVGMPADPTASERGSSTGRSKRATTMVVGALGVIALIVVAALWWRANARRPQAAGRTPGKTVQRNLTRLTFGTGLQTDVTFSPDGRFVAFASDRAGNFDIWVQPVAGGDAVQITRSPAQDTQPAWSPDGSTLVFRSERSGGGLFLVPALGGEERQLTSFGVAPSWTAKGSEILFLDAPSAGESAGSARLYDVPLSGAGPHELLSSFFANGEWAWVGPHPDGRISALGRHHDLGYGFFTMTRDGQDVKKSKHTTGNELASLFDLTTQHRFWWHPSGSMVFVQTRVNGVTNLWRVQVDASTLAWQSAERLTTGPGSDVAAALSPDGDRIAFTTRTESSRLWVFSLDSRARQLGPGRPLTEEGASAHDAAISPDGQQVAYNLTRTGSAKGELWVTRLSDGTSERVASDAWTACWSPDGKAIAYYRNDRLVARQLGGNERVIVAPAGDSVFFPRHWLADGHLLGSYREHAFAEPTALVLWTISNGISAKPERVLLVRPRIHFWQSTFSPNRRWLSFIFSRADQPAHREIIVAPASSPDRWTRVAADHSAPDKPRWAPDGRTLYFISGRPTAYFNLWAVRFDPDRGLPVGLPYPMSAFDSPRFEISPRIDQSEMDVSAQAVVLTMQSTSGSIWMLDNADK